jgi:hypothetical protein
MSQFKSMWDKPEVVVRPSIEHAHSFGRFTLQTLSDGQLFLGVIRNATSPIAFATLELGGRKEYTCFVTCGLENPWTNK